MFRRFYKRRGKAASKPFTHRRVIAAPEQLESRDLPGGLLYLTAGFNTLLNTVAAPTSVIVATSPTSSAIDLAHEQSGSTVKPQSSAARSDQLNLLSDTSRSSGQPTVNSSVTKTQVSGAITNATASSAQATVASSVSIKFLSVNSPASNTSVPAEGPTAPLNAQPMPSTPAAGSSGGGGGGSNSSSGPPASGPSGNSGLSQASAALQSANTSSSTAPSAKNSAPASALLGSTPPVIEVGDIKPLLDRAAAATARNDAIIAIVDRSGNILGVRVESGVPIGLNTETMVFAIDGAVAEARTAAFFSSDRTPLTSRTVRFISQSTITEREVVSDPNSPIDTVNGPGYVAPVGLGGQFPPGVNSTPLVDLFAIEHTNRTSVVVPGTGGGPDITLTDRDSYGVATNKLPDAQSRGIGTLPGGVPLYKVDPSNGNATVLVGGIGVFFPGSNGYATNEQNFVSAASLAAAHKKPQTDSDRVNAPLVEQAEYMAVAAAGGIATPIGGVALPAGYVFLSKGQINLGGIKLEEYGPNPKGLSGLLAFGKKIGVGTVNGTDVQVTPTPGVLYVQGVPQPTGWLVAPHAGSAISANEVENIIEAGVREEWGVRSAIRLPLSQHADMVLSVTDKDGSILGLYVTPDATAFSIDVAIAKGRNVAYYANPALLQPQDEIDDNRNGVPDVAPGTAFTNRTFRYLAVPVYPSGSKTAAPGPFSILNDPGINPKNGENIGAPTPASQFQSVLGFDSFNPGTNFHEQNTTNANGVVFFPGSTPLYKNGQLVGGFGVSGDGVDQDDDVTFVGGGTFIPQPGGSVVRADETFVRGVRLPYQKFSRNPHA